jgi:hypothetical protein
LGHTSPHDPQFCASLEGLTQAPLQSTEPGAHTAVQTLWEQTSPLGQVSPHLPQSPGFEERSTQAPLQLVIPEEHAHWPATHETPEGHATPQTPQLA